MKAIRARRFFPFALLVLAVSLASPLTTLALPGGFGEGPTLVGAQPMDGDTGVATSSSLMLIFDTAMASSQTVQWSSNIDPAKVNYSWGFGSIFLTISYTGGWPGNSTITYTLNPPGLPPGFKDLLGNPLATTSGSFSTASGGGPIDPCQPQGSDSAGFFMSKSISFEQTSDAAPVIAVGETGGAMFQAALRSPTNNPITAARLTIPGGRNITLSNFFGTFLHFDVFASQALLDAAYPPGVYTLNVTRQNGGSQNANLNIAANATVPTPRLSNHSQLAGFNSAQGFTFRWDPFTGATATNSLSFEVHDNSGHSFVAPDLCVPRELAVTATSILVPANTLAANTGNEGSITFSRTLVQTDTLLADLPGFASLSKTTRFKFAATPTPTAPEFVGIDRAPSGLVTLRVRITAGAQFRIEFSTNLTSWAPIHTGTAAGDPVVVTHTPTAAAGFYRAILTP